MAIKKVIYGGNTLMDLTSDTVRLSLMTRRPYHRLLLMEIRRISND